METPGLGTGPRLDFGDGPRATGAMALAQPYMLHESTGAMDVTAYFAPTPALLVPAFAAIPPWLAKAGWFQAVMRLYFRVLRGVLLKRVPSIVRLVAEGDGRRRWLHASDGMEAAGLAIAAMAEAVAPRTDWTGARFIDDVCVLETIVERTNALAGAKLVTRSEPLRLEAGVGAGVAGS